MLLSIQRKILLTVAEKIYMNFKNVPFRNVISLGVIVAILATPFASLGQGIIPITSISGGSSVFAFRSVARAVRRFIPTVKPARSKPQRLETVARLKKQYETQAKTKPKVNRAKVVVYNTTAVRTATGLPPEQGSKLFAGFGEYYLDRGEIEVAIERFQEAMNLDPKNIEARTGYSEALAAKGNDLLAKDQATTAKGIFLEAIKFDPNNVAANFGLAEVYAELGETGAAIAAYEKSLTADPKLTEIYLPLGILYYQTGEIAKADDLLTKALALTPNNAETQFFLGLVRSAQNRNEEALGGFQKAKTLDPTLADAFFYSGQTLVRLKLTADAIADYQKATELKPLYFDAWFELGEAFLELKRFDDAIIAYTKAKALQNNNWEVYAGLGEAYRETRKFVDAQANYNLAAVFYVGVKDHSKETLAGFYSKTGLVIGQQCDIDIQKNIPCNWRSVINALKKAADISTDPIDQVNLGWAYFRQGHESAEVKDMVTAKPILEMAKVELEKAVAAGPPASEFALQNLASVQIDLGEFKGAIDTLNKLIAIRPNETFSKYALGVAYNKNGDLANAEKWLRTAADAEPTNLSYLVGLADTLISRKNGKELQKIIDRIRPIDAALAANLEQRKKLLRL